MADPIKLPTLDDILKQVPDKYKPFVVQMYPGIVALASQGLDKLAAWITRVPVDMVGAYKQLLDAMPADGLFAQWTKDDADWDKHLNDNADQKAAALAAISLILQGTLGVAKLLLGF